jgi:hypothetical protein
VLGDGIIVKSCNSQLHRFDEDAVAQIWLWSTLWNHSWKRFDGSHEEHYWLHLGVGYGMEVNWISRIMRRPHSHAWSPHRMSSYRWLPS